MQIQFPRRIQLGFRPWYGLTLRQLAYLALAGVFAGAIVLFGPVQGDGLLVRVLIGLGIIAIGVGLAFFRKDGLTAEKWIATQFKFWTRPQKRVWTRSDSQSATTRDQVAEMAIDSPDDRAGEPGRDRADELKGEPEAILRSITLLQPTAPRMAASPAVVVLIDMAMMLAFFAFAVYLFRGGLGEIEGWIVSQVGR